MSGEVSGRWKVQRSGEDQGIGAMGAKKNE